ncbi:MAG TPA: peptidoglycan bridge formation glycyltransferase FemA/FemB family protein [candidate division Zixibacteria bacterium]|nr:peptidoglycan bridge formation glycyltransferase FemA/FemB family protein [candidate division Zixibacteria bacterium]
MIELRPATGEHRVAWQAFLERIPYGDFLHDWAWGAVADFDGQPPRRYVVEDDGELVAIVAAQQRRLPLGRAFWYVPRGPVMDYRHPAAGERLRALALALREVARQSGAIAVKLEPRLERGSSEVAAFNQLRGLRHDLRTLQVGQTRLVELADDQTMLAGFDKDTRYAVRRAEREGVIVTSTTDGEDLLAIDGLHTLVMETQRRAGFPKPPLERYRIAWRGLAAEGRATIFQARRGGRLLAAGMLVVIGDRSYYLFAGSLREAPGEPKHYASYALQWAMMRHARDVGVRVHDLWGIAPEGAGPEHPWYGVGLFKKGFGGRAVAWAGTWDVVADPALYRLREAVGGVRRGLLAAPRTALRRARRMGR